MSERRYTEDEVSAIFAQAARAPESAPQGLGAVAGLTLSELQEIGKEVGLSPTAIARAAAHLTPAAKAKISTRRMFGLPIGVGTTVELGRSLSEREWEQLVSDLRMTFAARGRIEAHGTLRQWSNGNLHAMLEPVANGQRLRLGTMKRSARDWMTGGLMSIAGAAAMLVFSAIPSGDADVWRGAAMLGAVGVTMFSAGAVQLPRWARERRQQFDAVIARVLSTSNDGTA